MVTPANFFEFSTSTTCFQMQSDLYIQKLWLRRHRLGHTSVQAEKKKERTLNRIEHAFSSRYDSSRPCLISVCLTNVLILPRSSHLCTLLRMWVSTLVKRAENDRMLVAVTQMTNKNSVLYRSTSSAACWAAIPSSLSEWSWRAEARSRHCLLRCWHCDCNQTKQKRLSTLGKLELQCFGELTRYILTFFAAFINELATEFVTKMSVHWSRPHR